MLVIGENELIINVMRTGMEKARPATKQCNQTRSGLPAKLLNDKLAIATAPTS